MPQPPRIHLASWSLAAVAVLAPALGRTSDRSEILVAKGQVAYHQGKREDAVRLFREATVADERDAVAHEQLGQALLELGRRDEATRSFERALALDPASASARRGLERARGAADAGVAAEAVGTTVGDLGRIPPVRTAREEKRWSLNATVGFQYDSNVTVEATGSGTILPDGRIVDDPGDQDDVAFVLGFGGEYNLIQRSDFLLRFGYDFYQTLHPDLDDFDFNAQQPRLTASWGVTPALWLGMQAGYNYYLLGDDTYQGEPYVMPFLSYIEGEWGLTQVMYRHGQDTYFSGSFNDVRDGANDAVNASQTFFFGEDRYVTVGYQWNAEDPRHSNPKQLAGVNAGLSYPTDWGFFSNQAYLGLGLPLPWEAYADVLYLFRYDDYTDRNSFANFTKRRKDDGNFVYAGVTRPITEHLAVALTYYGSFNGSNIEDFDYTRHVVGTLLQVTY
jgi:hypothetical protein